MERETVCLCIFARCFGFSLICKWSGKSGCISKCPVPDVRIVCFSQILIYFSFSPYSWRRRSQDRPQRTDTAPSVSTGMLAFPFIPCLGMVQVSKLTNNKAHNYTLVFKPLRTLQNIRSNDDDLVLWSVGLVIG